MRDEAEIRGHRRTYIGALPGTIIRALRDAGSNNPVFMIDEIDKMGSDFRGDPSSAMLEVLDPEQNEAFRDHYLDLKFDLSQVMFICTAQRARHDPGAAARPHGGDPALRLHGRGEAAHRQALPGAAPDRAQRARAGQIEITDSAIEVVIEEYTREAGVRNLERELGSLCRKVAMEFAEGGKKKKKVKIGAKKARELLGKRKYFSEAKRRTTEAGVATGLAWTPVGRARCCSSRRPASPATAGSRSPASSAT